MKLTPFFFAFSFTFP
ncbi:TPA: pheA operon leader peptide PheL [Enterobacter roggenkampii]|nr:MULTISPECIES: pheA operon leader peptide PheL [Enterobacter]MDU7343606.1 pheA operon leader peptide PheL [Enterobacter sp.]HDS4389371.1 pheA operon leader peptide PheL [Enterobacter roggenkampii]